ncbi:hypothetical protein V3C99_006139, partial [Haemonchus contortus]
AERRTDAPKGMKTVAVYKKETYDRKVEVTRTATNPYTSSESLLPRDSQPILPPLENPQVHTADTKVDNKVVDGKFVHTETMTEHMMKEDNKQNVAQIQ